MTEFNQLNPQEIWSLVVISVIPIDCTTLIMKSRWTRPSPAEEPCYTRTRLRSSLTLSQFICLTQVMAYLQLTYIIAMYVGMASFFCILLEWLILSIQSSLHTWPFGEVLLWSLYLGVLSRDFAGIATKLQVCCVSVFHSLKNN